MNVYWGPETQRLIIVLIVILLMLLFLLMSGALLPSLNSHPIQVV